MGYLYVREGDIYAATYQLTHLYRAGDALPTGFPSVKSDDISWILLSIDVGEVHCYQSYRSINIVPTKQHFDTIVWHGA